MKLVRLHVLGKFKSRLKIQLELKLPAWFKKLG